MPDKNAKLQIARTRKMTVIQAITAMLTDVISEWWARCDYIITLDVSV